MVLRLSTTRIVAPIMMLAAAAAVFRVHSTPESIHKRQETARQACHELGGQWIVDDRNVPICKRD